MAERRQGHPRIALRLFGLVFVLAVYPLTVWWPAGWAWHHGRSEYLEMIIAIYATLGASLLLASRHPERHLSLIAFLTAADLPALRMRRTAIPRCGAISPMARTLEESRQ